MPLELSALRFVSNKLGSTRDNDRHGGTTKVDWVQGWVNYLWEWSKQEQGLTFIGGVGTDIWACHKQGMAKVRGRLPWVLGDVFGEDGLHTVGYVD